MKVEVIYKTVPYEVINGAVIHNIKEHEICSKIIEIESLTDIMNSIKSEGLSHHILHIRTLENEALTSSTQEKIKRVCEIIKTLEIKSSEPNHTKYLNLKIKG